jgi:FKBP-type peptidyl-prolyl cis-trans isomerase
MQKLLTLLIAAGILYTLVETRFIATTPKDQGAQNLETAAESVNNDNAPITEEPTGNFLEKTVSKVLVNVLKTEEGKIFFENILQPSNKPLAGSDQSYKINNTNFINSLFKINSFGQGSVGPASCGHIVTIAYQILSMDNAVVEEKTKTYTLGFKPILPGLDSVIVGMSVGQTRQAILPARYAYMEEKYRKAGVEPGNYYKINVTLKDIMPNNFVKDEDVKMFDDEIAYKMPLICGDRASFDAKITKLSNADVLYDSEANGKKLDITVGDINYPLIFGYALFGKIPIGTRTVIAKGKSFKGLGATSTKIFPKTQLQDDEYFMLELKNFGG